MRQVPRPHHHHHQSSDRLTRAVELSLALRGRHVGAWRTRWWRRTAAQGATSSLVASTRAADGRNGPGRGLSSLLRKFPADSQGEEDGRPRRVRSPTGTQNGQDSGRAARSPTGSCAAAGG